MKPGLSKTAMLLVLCCAASSMRAACKPDFSSRDKITKAEVAKWSQNLTEMGFWKSMVATDIDLILSIGRYGDVNAVNIDIVNKENDRDRAAFDSRYRAGRGDRFFLGFSDGEPLMFEASEVNNQSQIQQGKGLVMTVVLSAHVSDGRLAELRERLTSKRIDAVRAKLSSGLLERSIGEEPAEAMMEDFSCFYQYLDSRGIKLAANDQGTPATPAESDGGGQLDLVVEDILAQSKLTIQAMLRQDIEYLDRHIADDAVFSGPGKQLTKRMLLAQTMEQQKPPGPVRVRHSDVSSKTTGDVVEVTVTTTLAVQAGGNWRDFLEVRGTTRYRKVEGEWIMLGGTNEYEKPLR